MCFATTLGIFEVEAGERGVTRVRLRGRGRPREVGDGTGLAHGRQARIEILSFLAGESTSFSVPVILEGTDFQKSVWEYLAGIPYGQTRTYRDVAAALGRPRAVRAVGAACGANPTPVLVPCHRVVSCDGSLGGFGGGQAMKEALLSIERGEGSPNLELDIGLGATQVHQ